MIRFVCSSVLALAVIAGVNACSGPGGGPVAPTVGESPQTALQFDPRLQGAVVVPADPEPAQVYSWTEDNHLRFDCRLENRTDGAFALKVRATFLDDKGVPVDDQLPMRVFFSAHEKKSVGPFICGNTAGKKVQVYVSPAE